jgi:hypothetical protein
MKLALCLHGAEHGVALVAAAPLGIEDLLHRFCRASHERVSRVVGNDGNAAGGKRVEDPARVACNVEDAHGCSL